MMKGAPYTKYGNAYEANQIDPDKFPQKRILHCRVQEYAYHREDNQCSRSVPVVNFLQVNTISVLHEQLPRKIVYWNGWLNKLK